MLNTLSNPIVVLIHLTHVPNVHILHHGYSMTEVVVTNVIMQENSKLTEIIKTTRKMPGDSGDTGVTTSAQCVD